MKYVSIDIESTGLNPELHQVLEIGAVIDDLDKSVPISDLPTYSCIINHREITGQVVAIDMNSRIFKILSEYTKIKDSDLKEEFKEKHNILEPDEAVIDFYFWLYVHSADVSYTTDLSHVINGNIQEYKGVRVPVIGSKSKTLELNVAGKNFGTFDKLFLERLPRWKQLIKINQRILDPSILYLATDDRTLPSLSECKKRAGLDSIVTHNAIDDAIDVVQLIRKHFKLLKY
jgi:DNA polymerase III epsilon subunit-like protein